MPASTSRRTWRRSAYGRGRRSGRPAAGWAGTSNAAFVARCRSAGSRARCGLESARNCAAAKQMRAVPSSSATYTTASPSRTTPGGRRIAAAAGMRLQPDTAGSILSAVTSRSVRGCSRAPSSVRHSRVRWPSALICVLLSCPRAVVQRRVDHRPAGHFTRRELVWPREETLLMREFGTMLLLSPAGRLPDIVRSRNSPDGHGGQSGLVSSVAVPRCGSCGSWGSCGTSGGRKAPVSRSSRTMSMSAVTAGSVVSRCQTMLWPA